MTDGVSPQRRYKDPSRFRVSVAGYTSPIPSDLRRATPGDPASAWLRDRTEYRAIGAVATDGFGSYDDPGRAFDVIIFFERNTPTALLPF